MRKKISNGVVAALSCPPGKDRVFVWDSGLTGFGVATFPTGKKTYVVQYRQNGRSHRLTLGEHGRLTPTKARKKAKKVLGAIEDGDDPIERRREERAARSFREVADEFMRLHVNAKRKPKTATEYAGLLRLHLLPAFGSYRLKDLKKVDVARFHAGMAATPGSANRCLAVMSSIWSWAAGRDEVSGAVNPAAGVERFPERSCERYLSNAELARLGDALRLAETDGIPWQGAPTSKHSPKMRATVVDPYAVAAIRLLILTGARLREILHAKWSYVDWDRGMMLLPDSKTGKKTIYLSAPALALLKELPHCEDDVYVIQGRGKDKPRADLKRPWAAVAHAAGLEGVRIHDLRHSFAATGAGASLGLPMIGKLLGHSQPATTARYAHLDADPMKLAANLIGSQIAAAMEKKAGEIVRFRKAM